jgi:uncharacterized membrane protein
MSSAPAPSAKPSRWESLDLLRGLVILLMALDHVRDFFSASAGLFEPTDLARTTAPLFFTRWLTHFCAPIFVLLAGIGAYQAGVRGRTKPQLSWFLFSRGLWLILLELFFITPFGWSFQLTWNFVRLQVIWVIGLSLVVLSGLVGLPSRFLGWAGLLLIAGHNAFDGPRGELLGPAWKLLHSLQFFPLPGGRVIASLYPLVPWVGVLLAGYGLGELWTWPAPQRQRWLVRLGLALLVVFSLLRLSNLYGDPNPWTVQPDPLFTLLSILNVSKYPPSLSFLALTLGPGLLMLAWLEARPPAGMASVGITGLRVFGRVPLFFYLLHLPLIHGLAVWFSHQIHGEATWLWRDPFALRRAPSPAPAGYGFDLWGVYAVWIGCVALLFPLCRWYGRWKQRQRHPLWSYL